MKKKECTDYIKSVFNETINEFCNELEIEIPNLVFNKESNGTSVFYTLYNYSSNGFAIIDTKAINSIYVNQDKAIMFIKAFKYFGKKAMHDAIYFSLAHECRHLWQANNGFYNGTPLFRLSSYSSRSEEADANNFALKCCKSKKQNVLCKYFIETQEETNIIELTIKFYKTLLLYIIS